MRNSQVGDLLVATTEVDGTLLNRGVCLLVYEDEQTAVGLMLNRPMQMVSVNESELEALKNQADPTAPPGTGSGQEESSAKPSRLTQLQPESRSPAESMFPVDDTSDAPPVQPLVAIMGEGGEMQTGQVLLGTSLHFGGPLSGPVIAVHGAEELGETEAGEGIYIAAQRDHLEALLQAEQPHPYRLIVGHLGWSQDQLNQEIAAGVWHRLPATADILSTSDEWLWPKLIRSASASSVSRWLQVPHVADAHLLN